MNHPELDELFAKIAVEDRFISREQLIDCRNAMETIAKVGVKRSIQDIMIDKGFLTKEEVLEILRRLVREGVRPHIGNFEIINKIGEGGMGAVYKARQISLDRIVALKVLPPRLAKDEIFVRRFTREAKTAAKLAHKNIITILDVGESNGFHFIAMEFIDGATVADIVERNGRVAEHEALRIAKEVAEGLAFAAQFRIVHRDIKPANIMISRDGTVKLCDMGLAKQQLLEDASVTESGAAIGTPLYMSPEQARGNEQVDERSDIYSLGATLFFMVTGEPPFRGRTPLEILRKRLELPPPWAGELNPELSEWTCGTIQTMMATEATNRHQSAEDVVQALESRGGRAQAVVARVVRAVQKDSAVPADVVARRLRRTKINIIASSVAIVLAVMFVIGLVLLSQRGKDKDKGKEAPVSPAPVARAPQPAPSPRPPKPVVKPPRDTAKKPPKKPPKKPAAQPDPHADLKAQVLAMQKKGTYGAALSLLKRFPPSEKKWAARTRKNIYSDAQKAFDVRSKKADALVEKGDLKGAIAIYTELKAYDVPAVTKLADEQLGDIRAIQRREQQRLRAVAEKEFKGISPEIREFVKAGTYDEGIAHCTKLAKQCKNSLVRRWIGYEKDGLAVLKEIRERATQCGERMAGQEFTISGMTGKIVGVEDGNVVLDIRGNPFNKPLDKLKPTEMLALALGGEMEESGHIHLMRGVFFFYHGDVESAREELQAARVKGEKKASGFVELIKVTESSARDSLVEKLLAEARDLFEKRKWQEVVARVEEAEVSFADADAYKKNEDEFARLGGRAKVCLLAWAGKDVVLVKGGKFIYQNDAEASVREFLIDRYEVTNRQYKAFVDYIAKTGDHSFCYEKEPKNKDHVPLGFTHDSLSKPDQPVVGLDWYDAYAYAACVFKRLPTEKEWEKAARGEKGWLYPWGSQPDETRMVTGALDATRFTVPVKDSGFVSGASPFGVLHMLGNAAEWTADWFNAELRGGRVVRGGAWDTRPANVSLDATCRVSLEPTVKKLSVGFRCAKSAK